MIRWSATGGIVRTIRGHRPWIAGRRTPNWNGADGTIRRTSGDGDGRGERHRRGHRARLAAQGAAVLIADIQDEAGERLAVELGERAAFRHCNVADEQAVAGAVAEVVDR